MTAFSLTAQQLPAGSHTLQIKDAANNVLSNAVTFNVAAAPSNVTATPGSVVAYIRSGQTAHGDTQYAAWRTDGSVLVTTCDTKGFNSDLNVVASGNTKAGRNLTVNTLTGSPSDASWVGAALFGSGADNALAFFGGENEARPAIDNWIWKATGLASVNGDLYLAITDQGGGSDGRTQSRFSWLYRSSNNGTDWIRPGGTLDVESNSASPQFSVAAFRRPSFIDFGRDGQQAGWPDGADTYVYAVSNNGLWDNGDAIYLGRCLRTNMAANVASNWTFYTGLVGGVPQWGALASAAPIFSAAGKCSQTNVSFVPSIGKYILPIWYYVRSPGLLPSSPDYYGTASSGHTKWEFYSADHPWGPWTSFWSREWTSEGYYNPTLPTGLMQGTTVWLLFTGNYWDLGGLYSLHSMSLQLQVG